MRIAHYFSFVATLLLVWSVSVRAQSGFATSNLVLYQPDDVLQARVPSVQSLSEYVKRIEAVCAKHFADERIPESLQVVVAVRPDKSTRIWFISSVYAETPKSRAELQKAIQAVKPCDVVGGPLAFAISATIAGGDGKASNPSQSSSPPMPKAWTDAARKKKERVIVPDGILEDVWPSTK